MSRKSPVVIPPTSPRLVGMVDRDGQDRTRRVVISYSARHPRYGKYVRQRTVLHVHDEKNETKVGDKVEVMETRPLSRLKRWRVVSVLLKAVTTDAVAISEKDVAALVPTKITKA